MANENASKRQQIRDFALGKAIDPRDRGAKDFLQEPSLNDKTAVFVNEVPMDESASVFLNGISLHPSAKDFLGD